MQDGLQLQHVRLQVACLQFVVVRVLFFAASSSNTRHGLVLHSVNQLLASTVILFFL